MKNEEFAVLLQERIERIRKTLEVKAKEYAKGSRMHNFERGSKILQCSPERVLIGFFLKHLVSVLDIVDQIERDHTVSQDQFDEKIGDAINYLILLDIMVRGKQKNSKESHNEKNNSPSPT